MAEALAILNHATKVSQKADETLKVDLIDIKDLKAKIDIARCRCTAKVVLAQTGSQQTKTSQQFLSERQNDFVQTSTSDSSPFMIAQVPAAMQPTACTPEVFDIMKKNIPAPNLNHRIKKRVKKKGTNQKSGQACTDCLQISCSSPRFCSRSCTCTSSFCGSGSGTTEERREKKSWLVWRMVELDALLLFGTCAKIKQLFCNRRCMMVVQS